MRGRGEQGEVLEQAKELGVAASKTLRGVSSWAGKRIDLLVLWFDAKQFGPLCLASLGSLRKGGGYSIYYLESRSPPIPNCAGIRI